MLLYAISAKNFVILAKFLLFEKIYIARLRRAGAMQRYLWHADYADKTDSRGFFIIYFLIRDNS